MAYIGIGKAHLIQNLKFVQIKRHYQESNKD